jgi:acyl phosphate:glycerol-3-phosphate acyltransferase
MELIIVFFLSYLSGSIPFGLILTKASGSKDIRKIGSGNIGATNVLRSGKKYLAILTLILDVLKGYIAVTVTQKFFPEQTQISALIVFLGHVFPIWLKFKGGKGVATYLGALLALSLSLSLLFIFTWIILSLIFKYSSLSSMFAAFAVFIINLIKSTVIKEIDPNYIFDNEIKLLLFIFFILIIFTHRQNIYNLKNKSETKIKI